MDKLRVLITNHTAAARAGSELYIRDIGTALIERGHTPIVYSKQLGDVASELRAATIPVIDNLDMLAAAPDLIHGQDHLQTMEAMLYFPDTPGVFFCHGWMPWEASPPRFPRILRYVAVDEPCRDRLVLEGGIPEERVRLILNFADLDRFKPRGPLPPRPLRAALFSNYVNEHTPASAVREACEREGIALDVIGMGVGNACEKPESVLGGYDLVFAIARSAIEALAVGSAVVLCSPQAVGRMVTTENLDALRPLNFGIRALREPLTVEAVSREIARYDPQDAAEVSRRMRSVANLDAAVDEILALYREALEEWAGAGGRDLVAEGRAVTSYLQWLAPRIRDNERLQGERDWIQAEYYKLDSRLYALNNEAAQLKEQLGESRQLVRTLEERAAEQSFLMRRDLAEARGDNRRLVASSETLQAELSEKERAIQQLSADLSEKERSIQRLSADLSEKERSIHALSAGLADKEQSVSRLSDDLADREERLRKITGSLGWRLLSLYGPVKYRLLLPPYNMAKRVFGQKPGREV